MTSPEKSLLSEKERKFLINFERTPEQEAKAARGEDFRLTEEQGRELIERTEEYAAVFRAYLRLMKAKEAIETARDMGEMTAEEAETALRGARKEYRKTMMEIKRQLHREMAEAERRKASKTSPK